MEVRRARNSRSARRSAAENYFGWCNWPSRRYICTQGTKTLNRRNERGVPRYSLYSLRRACRDEVSFLLEVRQADEIQKRVISYVFGEVQSDSAAGCDRI